MKFSKILNNSKGMSIVQVMIAFGLMGALAVGMMQLMDNQQKQQKTMSYDLEINNLKASLSKIVNTYAFCSANFRFHRKGDKLNYLVLKELDINNVNQKYFIEKDQQWQGSKLWITDIEMIPEADEASYNLTSETNPDGSGVMYLKVTVNKGNPTKTKRDSYGAVSKEVIVPVFVKLGFFTSWNIVSSIANEALISNALKDSCNIEFRNSNPLPTECGTTGCLAPQEMTGNAIAYDPISCEQVYSGAEKDKCSGNIFKDIIGAGAAAQYIFSLQCRITDDDPNEHIFDCLDT